MVKIENGWLVGDRGIIRISAIDSVRIVDGPLEQCILEVNSGVAGKFGYRLECRSEAEELVAAITSAAVAVVVDECVNGNAKAIKAIFSQLQAVEKWIDELSAAQGAGKC